MTSMMANYGERVATLQRSIGLTHYFSQFSENLSQACEDSLKQSAAMTKNIAEGKEFNINKILKPAPSGSPYPYPNPSPSANQIYLSFETDSTITDTTNPEKYKHDSAKRFKADYGLVGVFFKLKCAESDCDCTATAGCEKKWNLTIAAHRNMAFIKSPVFKINVKYNTGVTPSSAATHDKFTCGVAPPSIGRDHHSYGTGNTYLGVKTGDANTTGSHNTILGYHSGRYNTTGAYNTFVGYAAGESNTTGIGNVIVGQGAGWRTTTGGHNVFMGRSAGYHHTTGTGNTFIGNAAGNDNTTGGGNVFIGRYSGYKNKTTHNNTFVGYLSGHDTTGSHNTFVGYEAGRSHTTGTGNTMVGYQVGKDSSVSGSHNVLMGLRSGTTKHGGQTKGGISGSYNMLLGHAAGRQATISGNYNKMFGTAAGGQSKVAGSHQNFIGAYSGYKANIKSGADYNTFVGFYAGREAVFESGKDGNTLIGREAMKGKTITTSGGTYIAGTNLLCPVGQYLRGFNPDGTKNCQPAGLTCPTGQRLSITNNSASCTSTPLCSRTKSGCNNKIRACLSGEVRFPGCSGLITYTHGTWGGEQPRGRYYSKESGAF